MGRDSMMEDHVIVVGLGQVGLRVLESLRRLGQQVVAIESDGDSELVDRAREMRVPVIVGDVRKANTLTRAGLDRARAVIACTDDDLTNLEVAIDARHERPDVRVVMRLFDQRLAEKFAEGFNIQVAFSSSALSAPAFAAAAIDRSVRGSLEVGDKLYIHSEFDVPSESALAGRTVSEIRNEFDAHTLRFVDNAEVEHWAPAFDFVIEGGGSLAVIGPFDAVAEMKRVCGITEDLVKARVGPA